METEFLGRDVFASFTEGWSNFGWIMPFCPEEGSLSCGHVLKFGSVVVQFATLFHECPGIVHSLFLGTPDVQALPRL